jgi:hypothetical protein
MLARQVPYNPSTSYLERFLLLMTTKGIINNVNPLPQQSSSTHVASNFHPQEESEIHFK